MPKQEQPSGQDQKISDLEIPKTPRTETGIVPSTSPILEKQGKVDEGIQLKNLREELLAAEELPDIDISIAGVTLKRLEEDFARLQSELEGYKSFLNTDTIKEYKQFPWWKKMILGIEIAVPETRGGDIKRYEDHIKRVKKELAELSGKIDFYKKKLEEQKS